MVEQSTPEQAIADDLRTSVKRLNDLLATAAHAGLRVEITQTRHQTCDGVPMSVLDSEIYRKL